eukprot:2074423-Amphidinium_carterae.1
MIYSDGGPELIAACRQLGLAHYSGEPGRSTTHARAERKIRVVKDTIRALLLQSALPTSHWVWVVQAACSALNLTQVGDDGFTPYQRRFRKWPEKILQSPFGSLVYCIPPKTAKQVPHPFAPRWVPCVSLGPMILPGGRMG